MWKSLAGWLQNQITMAQDIARLQNEVAELRQEQTETARTLEQLLFALQRESDQWRHQNEVLLLKLELELVKVRAGLPPSSGDGPKLGD